MINRMYEDHGIDKTPIKLATIVVGAIGVLVVMDLLGFKSVIGIPKG